MSITDKINVIFKRTSNYISPVKTISGTKRDFNRFAHAERECGFNTVRDKNLYFSMRARLDNTVRLVFRFYYVYRFLVTHRACDVIDYDVIDHNHEKLFMLI